MGGRASKLVTERETACTQDTTLWIMFGKRVDMEAEGS